jgi:hypothetical protein
MIARIEQHLPAGGQAATVQARMAALAETIDTRLSALDPQR